MGDFESLEQFIIELQRVTQATADAQEHRVGLYLLRLALTRPALHHGESGGIFPPLHGRLNPDSVKAGGHIRHSVQQRAE